MKKINIGRDNSTFQQIVALKENRNKRVKLGLFFVEGIQNIKDAIANKWEIEAFIYSKQTELSHWAKSVINIANINYVIEDDLMKKLCDKTITCELMAIIKMKKEHVNNYSDNPIFVLLDRPSKKGNFGTIIRSCDAFGVSKIFYSGHSVDIYDPAVITASMGSFFKIPFSFIVSNKDFIALIEKLKREFKNLKVIATSLQVEKNIFECNFSSPILLLIGNEAEGLSQFYVQSADDAIKIPMREGIDSLNVACATTTCLYEINRQRISKAK